MSIVIKDMGFIVNGTSVVVGGPLGNLTLTPSPTQLLRVIAEEKAATDVWNEATGAEAYGAGVMAIQAVFDGAGTIQEHVASTVSFLGINLPPNIAADLSTAAAEADLLVGTKITPASAYGVVQSLLAKFVPSLNLSNIATSVETAVGNLIASIKAKL
jgi:hypothetical protein